MLRFSLLFFVSFSCALTMDSTFSLGALDNTITQTMQLIVEGKYENAEKETRALAEKNKGVACILNGMVLIGRYDDLGDTTALLQATKLLTKCKSTGYWEALRIFELGYTQSEQGHSLKGAIHTKSAAEIFEKSNARDSKAFYAIYAYYMNNSLNWLPFVSDNSDSYLKALENGAKHSIWFWPLFSTSLIWMHYDRKEYDKGLQLADSALKRVPNHPVFLQIKADMLYRMKQYKQAAQIYEASASDYLTRTGKSLRYWCAVANLIRIYHDAGNEQQKIKWQKELNAPEFNTIKEWMPNSLMDDLKERNLLK